MRLKQLFQVMLLAGGICGAGVASALGPGLEAVKVVEFMNTAKGRYFLTGDANEIAAIEAGAAGPGWARTGYAFTSGSGNPASRFMRTSDGAPMHFFTIDEDEASTLKQPGSGWEYEGSAFFGVRPNAAGQCPSVGVLDGYFRYYVPHATYPVYRLYAGAKGFGHRFVPSAYERAAMIDAGWIDEGTAFCTLNIPETALESYSFDPSAAPAAGSWACDEAARSSASCIAFNNLSPPKYALWYFGNEQEPFRLVSGLGTEKVYTTATPFLPANAEQAAAQTFFQVAGNGVVGMSLDSHHRGPSDFTSIVLRRQLGAAERFFPWSGSYLSETQLTLSFSARLRTLAVNTATGHAYGHPTIEFVDQASGHHVLFSVLTFGTVPQSDFVAPDLISGKAIVATSFREGSPYGRSIDSMTLVEPESGLARPFEFRIDRVEFQLVLDAARTIDPVLSPNPANYFVDNFQFKNETFRTGQLGMSISGLELRLVPR